ncbi:hypothetical protein CCR75_005161 [Bremia lactucae]|uniref:Uncharacterized protein n=1 Tax=Bremia lactucae TaxID=4779 RepID=A0A976ICB6_BRELC|nr:hypothetical protein CCR75_005161 [Bremia lactucae]
MIMERCTSKDITDKDLNLLLHGSKLGTGPKDKNQATSGSTVRQILAREREGDQDYLENANKSDNGGSLVDRERCGTQRSQAHSRPSQSKNQAYVHTTGHSDCDDQTHTTQKRRSRACIEQCWNTQ